MKRWWLESRTRGGGRSNVEPTSFWSFFLFFFFHFFFSSSWRGVTFTPPRSPPPATHSRVDSVGTLSQNTRPIGRVFFSVFYERKKTFLLFLHTHRDKKNFRPPPPTKQFLFRPLGHSVSLSNSRLLVFSLGSSLWQVGATIDFHLKPTTTTKSTSVFFLGSCVPSVSYSVCGKRVVLQIYISLLGLSSHVQQRSPVCFGIAVNFRFRSPATPPSGQVVSIVCDLSSIFFFFPSLSSKRTHRHAQESCVWGLQFFFLSVDYYLLCVTTSGATGVLCVALWWASFFFDFLFGLLCCRSLFIS